MTMRRIGMSPVLIALARTGLFLSILVFGRTATPMAQAIARPLPSWDAEQLLPASGGAALTRAGASAARSHTGTGLLIGGLIGLAATTVFLIGFCGDPDTKCEADEVGRAVLFIAVPAAALGALIGSLIHTGEDS